MLENKNKKEKTKVNLYLISRTRATSYDQYDAFVIRADTPEDARVIAATAATYLDEEPAPGHYDIDEYQVWTMAEKSSVELLAADVGGEPGEVLGSFNRG